MKITTDLVEKDYLTLIEEARGDILNYTSHKPIKIFINNNEIIADMKCLGVKISDGCRTIGGEFIPPIMKFGFRISFESDNFDLVKEMLESQNVYVDNKKYYVGDYYLKCVGINKFVDGSNFMNIQITTLFMDLKNIEEIIKIIQMYDDFKITIEPLKEDK